MVERNDQVGVLIVGAGPTGLLLALWLQRLKVKFRIVAKAAGTGEHSRAMVMHARTMELYRQLGIADAIQDQAQRANKVSIRKQGKIQGSLALGDSGVQTLYPYVTVIPQDVHEQILLSKFQERGGEVEWQTELTEFSQTQDGVSATLHKETGTDVCGAAYIVGCDGARSSVRESAHIELPGGTYSEKFYVADVMCGNLLQHDAVNISVSGSDFVFAIPIADDGQTRLVGQVPENANENFDDIVPVITEVTKFDVKSVNWFATYRVHHRVASHFRKDRAFIAGDAAHIHSPVGGQGMNTGLGDASNLAWKLAAVLTGKASEKILDTYEAERQPFAQTLVNTTDRVFTYAIDKGVAGWLLRSVMLPIVFPNLLKISAVRYLGFLRLSQIHITYSSSNLSEGTAGFKAGDRLPYIPGSEDNYRTLDQLDWQVHVFGQVSDATKGELEAQGIKLVTFPWSADAKKAGYVENAIYLVRPDGYVGFADSTASPERLKKYLGGWGIKPFGSIGA